MGKLTALLAVLSLEVGQGYRAQEPSTFLQEGEQHPVHMAKLAAFGKNLAEFIENAEKNNPLLGGIGLMEVNATSGAEAPQVVSQDTFCPEAWRAQLEEKGTLVGGGAFGKVYVSKLKCDGSAVAIKVQKRTRETDNEARLMISLDHPNVVKAYASAGGPERDTTSMIMEACSGGDLDGKKDLAASEKARLFYETLQGLAYMHSNDLVHSDLKLDNVMLSHECTSSGPETCHSKVADLGLTCSLRSRGDCDGIRGCPKYLSPGELARQQRSKPDDLWAMGIMLHQMIKGRDPDFLQQRFPSVEHMLHAIADLRMKGYAYRARDRSAKEQLLAGLLVASSRQRISVDRAAALAKVWMQEEGVGALQGTPAAKIPKCWTLCEKAKCDWRTSSCTLDDTERAQCTGRERPIAGDKEEKLLSITIRKGFGGSFGFHTRSDGSKVTSVDPGGQAERAGLRRGDIIVKVQNKPWKSLSHFQRVKIMHQAHALTVGVQRR